MNVTRVWAELVIKDVVIICDVTFAAKNQGLSVFLKNKNKYVFCVVFMDAIAWLRMPCKSLNCTSKAPMVTKL